MFDSRRGRHRPTKAITYCRRILNEEVFWENCHCLEYCAIWAQSTIIAQDQSSHKGGTWHLCETTATEAYGKYVAASVGRQSIAFNSTKKARLPVRLLPVRPARLPVRPVRLPVRQVRLHFSH